MTHRRAEIPTRSRWPLAAVCVLLLITCMSSAGPARAKSGGDFVAAGMFVLAGLQIPAATFEYVAYAKMRTQLADFSGDAGFADKARGAGNCNLIGGVLHSVKFIAWAAGGAGAMSGSEQLATAMVLVNGGLDMANAIMGITAGAFVLGAKGSAGLAGTPMNEAATFSGIVHLIFGGISALVTIPELLVGLGGVIATASIDPPSRVRFAVSPQGVCVRGRF